jgi:serine/threonine-protein kinase
MADTLIGQRLGKYDILEERGRGGFAAVYRARDCTLEREVALKVLHPQLLVDPVFVERFQREARTLANLRHPHIVTIYESGAAEGRLFVAMELARGPSLAAALAERGRLPWDEALALLKPVCQALDYAHAQGVAHRDLKPANVLLDAERGPLLSDFGFARLMAASSMSLSLSGGVVGTPSYIAPEVWERDASGPPGDVYALGCIVYELLAGQVLFAGQTPIQVMRAHDTGPRFPDAWPGGVPAGIATVLSKALARDPAARYAGAGALWHALEDLNAAARLAQAEEERGALAAQWQAETEAAMRAGEWGTARMAVGRWLAAAPGDARALAAQAELDRRLVPRPPAGATRHAPPGWQAALLAAVFVLAAGLWFLALRSGTGERGLPASAPPAPYPTYTPYPTATPAPPPATATPYPTYTPYPTLTLVPAPPAAPSTAVPPNTAVPGALPTATRAAGDASPDATGTALAQAGPASQATMTALAGAVMGEQATATAQAGYDALTITAQAGLDAVGTATAAVVAAQRATATAWAGAAATAQASATALAQALADQRATAVAQVTATAEWRLRVWVRETDGMTMVGVPAGEFLMGSPAGEGADDEHPQHTVYLDGYWIDQTEVTNGEYRRCLDTGACTQPGYWTDDSYNQEDQPVVGVDWNQATAYCRWAGARLPTEAEWEKAARGTDGRNYPWGNEDATCERANYAGCAGRPLPVGSEPAGASPFGVLDMAGNVLEWTADWFDGGYYARSPERNPPGPGSGQYRVARGGSWGYDRTNARSAYRVRIDPTYTLSNVGFRCSVSSTSSP